MGGDDIEGFDAVAAELLLAPPAEFTARRNARADAATGDVARRIRSLRKPTVAAWAVNLLSADATFREALELSRALREAQDDLDAAELARLGKQRRALVAALVRRAVELAASAGVQVAAGARDEVERTVNAAIVDPVAGAVVGAGRLVRPLDPGALDPGTVGASVAGSVPGAEAAGEGSADGATAPSRDDLAERRARREAERLRREAERIASEARRTLTRADAALTRARERADLLHERVEDLRRDLARVSGEADAADEAVSTRERERRAASDAAADAARTLDRAGGAR